MPDASTLHTRLREILRAGPASAGVAVRHVERGERFHHDGDTPYPMASVFKIPVMVEAFRQQGEGRFSLDDRWELHDEDKATGSGVLTRLAPGLRLTVRDLVTLMIIISDNTATDMLVRRLGTERITATMRALGLRQTVVVQTCRELVAGIWGDVPPSLAPHEVGRHLAAHPPNPDSPSYGRGPGTNVSTANEMAELLARIHTGEGLEAIGVGAAARAEQRRILLLQQLNDRLPAFLPQGVPVAHKTGTLPGPWAIRNDAGLLDVGEGGVVAVAVFTRTAVPAALNDEARARLLRSIDEEIAALGRAVYQHYAGTG